MLMASITRPAKAIGSRLPLDEFESQHASTTRRRGLPDRSGRAWAEVCQSALARHLRSHTLIRQGRQVASSADVQSRDQILCLSGPACVSAKLVGGACPPKSRPLMRLPSHTPEQTTFGAAVSLSFLGGGGEGKERERKGKERKGKKTLIWQREREREMALIGREEKEGTALWFLPWAGSRTSCCKQASKWSGAGDRRLCSICMRRAECDWEI